MVDAFELYLSCRTVQVFHLAVEGERQTQHIIVNLPTGYHHLPEAGGVLDQPCWTMSMFTHFQAGEVAAATRKLSG